jgi:hypothetical protein
MANSKLLKEAIADAKAVKETALANAKLALEEAFTPRLQSILSQKLRAEAEETGDDEMQNEELDSSDIGSKVGQKNADTPGKQPTLDADTDLSVGVKKSTAKLGLEDPNRTIVNTLMEDEDGMDDKDQEIAELRARLAELEGEDMEDDSMEDTEDEGMYSEEDDEMGDDGEDYEITGDEEEDTESDEDDMDLESIIRELEAQMGDDDGESEEEPTMEGYSDGSDAGTDKGEDPKVVMNNEAEEADKEETDEVIDLEEILREMEADMKNEDEARNPAKAGEDGALKAETLKAELNEAYKTIKSLQSTINEVNLLNAKLLFANKLFRAHNMTNEQKVKVIETLDRTKSVREVKLVYATLAENLKPVTVSNKAAKKSISEGFASKVVKSTKPAVAQKQVIAESANFADRFKKLAGIIK